MACGSGAFAQTAPVPGKWQRQLWTGINGSNVSSLTDSPRFHQSPDSTTLADSSYSSLGSNYGARTRGYITPATTGLHTFWVSGDDETQLFLSSDSSKWSARKIAGSAAWTSPQAYDDALTQHSVSQFLEAGRSYYVELLHKEGDGGDHASVAWAMQGVDLSSETNWAAASNGSVASSSSTYVSAYSNYNASNAIDGNPATLSHTNDEASACLTVDFRQDRLVSRLEFVNRNILQTRLSNFRATVEDSSGAIVASKDFYTDSGSVGASEGWSLPVTVAARRVKVRLLGPNRENNYYLSLAELRAFGPSTSTRNWSHEAGAITTQSSTYSGAYPAAYAVDGDPSTTSHSADIPGSSLLTDLGADRLIDTVHIVNRQVTTCMSRLSNFRISILDAADAVLTSQDFYPATGYVKAALRWELPAAVTGRKVKVELLGLNREGNSYLSIAELNVWGRENAGITQRGLRSLVSADVMSSYDPATTDDGDDDSMPDATELACGLDPNDASDALGDLDHDGFSNVVEIRANANPVVKDSIPGLLLDEIWHEIPGDNLTAAAYKAAMTREPDELHAISTSQAFDQGEQYVRRVRGYITAPVTGSYQFWGAADSDVDMFLSTSDSKFDRQLILDDKVFTPIASYDVDISQKSRLITLTAGQKYHFEMWHKEGIGGSYFSVAWKKPGGSRELIPGQFLSSYAGEANDQDDDYLKDDYEIANGLSITDNGRSPGSKDGAYGDLDGDGLTNLDEMKAGSKANQADSDGDGVSDYDEANFFDSATLANDIGPFTPVVTLNGDAYTASFGEWEKFGDHALQRCRRGSVTYPVTVPVSGVHSLKFAITSIADGDKSEQYEFDLKLDGKRIACKTIDILPNGTATLAVLSPWLNAGEAYQLELFVDNSYNSRRVSIDQLQILAAGGTDSNDNGTPDWVDIRSHDTNGFDATTVFSKTSPATVEGNVKYFELLDTGGASVAQAPNGRFFTEVGLTPGTPVTLDFSFENGAVNQAPTIQWLPTNLLLENSLTLRQGDSLLLTAFQNAENASLETYSVTANGEIYTQTADQPTAVAFMTPGTTSIQLAHTGADAIETTRSVTVTVLPRFTIAPPICVTGHPRTWTHPALPAGATLQFDDQITRWQETAANTYTLATTTPINQPMLIRQGAAGQILGVSEVKSACIRTYDLTGNILDNYTATTSTVRLPVAATGAISDLEIRCNIFIGGVTFADGTTSTTLEASDFDSFDTSSLIFLKANSAHSNCSNISIWHAGTRVALFN